MRIAPILQFGSLRGARAHTEAEGAAPFDAMSIRRLWSNPKTLGDVNMVTQELRNLYYKRLLPIEKHYSFHHFHSPSYEDADFDNKPMVLVMGQYSTGKTTFIR